MAFDIQCIKIDTGCFLFQIILLPVLLVHRRYFQNVKILLLLVVFINNIISASAIVNFKII